MPGSWEMPDYNQQPRWSIEIFIEQAWQNNRLDINDFSVHPLTTLP